MIEAVTRQNIHWHIYYNPEVGLNDPYYREYFELAEKNPYFHFHTPLANDQLCREITQYDFGYMVHDVRGTIYTDIVHDISMANKIFTYLEAGLPMIVGDTFKAVADFVEEHSIGFVVDSTDLSDLYDRIKNADYEQLRQNALKARSDLSLSNNIHKLDELIERLR
jgi:hypothetical protein